MNRYKLYIVINDICNEEKTIIWNILYFLDGGEEEGEEIGEKEGQYFVDQATGQYYFQTSDGETMTVVSAPGVEEPSKLIYTFVHSFG